MLDVPLLSVTAALGLAGGFAAGLLGLGGAILLIPLLLIVPPWLGVGRYEMSAIAGMTLVHVFAAGIAGLSTHIRLGHVDRGLATVMGLATFGSAFAGAWFSGMMSDRALEALFAALALAAAVMMLWPRRETPETPEEPLRYDQRIAAASAGVVGALAGLVGAGGAFILMPVMLNVLRVPVRTAVGTSLAVVIASATGGLLAKGLHGAIPLAPAAALVAGATLGAVLGGRACGLIPPQATRMVLVVVVVGIAAVMLGRLLL